MIPAMHNTTEITIGTDKTLDVRAVPCSVKHPLIVRTFQELAVEDYFILLIDHDPARLRDQFNAQWPGAFTWQYLQLGPEDFRVKITKIQSLPAGTTLPALNCGGH